MPHRLDSSSTHATRYGFQISLISRCGRRSGGPGSTRRGAVYTRTKRAFSGSLMASSALFACKWRRNGKRCGAAQCGERWAMVLFDWIVGGSCVVLCCVEAVACDCVVTHSSLHPSVFGATFRADLFSLFTLVCVFVVAFVRACAPQRTPTLVRSFVCASSRSNRAETSRLVAQHQTNVIDRLRDVTLELLTSLHVSAHTHHAFSFSLVRLLFLCLYQSDFLPGRDTQHRSDLFPSKTTRMFLVFAQLFKRLLVYAISSSQLQQSSAFLFLYKISLVGAMFFVGVLCFHTDAPIVDRTAQCVRGISYRVALQAPPLF